MSEVLAAVALVIVDLQILLALGAGSDLWTFATLVLSVQPVVMFTLLQIRAFHASCIQCVIILLALATGASIVPIAVASARCWPRKSFSFTRSYNSIRG